MRNEHGEELPATEAMRRYRVDRFERMATYAADTADNLPAGEPVDWLAMMREIESVFQVAIPARLDDPAVVALIEYVEAIRRRERRPRRSR